MEARAAAFPKSGATWIEVSGAYAMFDGIESPCTQTFGLGIFQAATAADLDSIEAFYRKRKAPTYHEVSPLADPSALALLTERGYQPFELSSVMFRPIGGALELATPRNPRISTRLIQDGEQALWAATAAAGWADSGAPADMLQSLMRISVLRKNAPSFLAELDGKPVAAGGLSISDGVALFAGASTIPQARKQGAQLALLHARLGYAVERGCDLAMMCAAPGSASQRNAERHGFRIAYTRIKWRLSRSSEAAAPTPERRPRRRSK